ncbi:sensor histidine kinase [Camelliibacillus cellulosilyticus]|uniref:histidine kinase n=1 Tax=Camelliibacillus cellulosilyticus TaxID=2174486 RepID=A0ABV9GRN1_9BACL
MIRIRTKLMIFFLILLLMMNAVAFIVYHSGGRSIDQYDQFLKRFYLLTTISEETDKVYETLSAYLVERTPDYYRKYLEESNQLKTKQEKLASVVESRFNYLTLENYTNKITSFLEECGIVADAFQKQKIDVYSEHLSEAAKIERYIQQSTLTLTGEELTHYQGFYQNMVQKNHYLQSMGISIFISTFFLGLLFALWFSRGITRPIAKLSAAAREISQGRFDGPDVTATTRDELRFLTKTFNDMRRNIRELISEIRKKSKLDQLLKEMELKHLQNQIHPHFLFNILNTISKTAYLEDAKETQNLIDSTAKLLRHNLGRLEEPTTLGKEVDIIREYFFLQSARFGDRVRFTTEIDERCLSTPVPNLTLQPLIENAFIHGIESLETGAEIRLQIKRHSNFVQVDIIDNGVGMKEAEVRQLLNLDEPNRPKNSQGHSTGLGFKNVAKRLQLFFGIDEPVKIESKPGEGTRISLFIPLNEAESKPSRIIQKGVF